MNPTEVVLFRRGDKIFAGNGAELVAPGADNELAMSKGAQTSSRSYTPFPSRGPHTRKDASDYPVPKALLQRALWRVDLE